MPRGCRPRPGVAGATTRPRSPGRRTRRDTRWSRARPGSASRGCCGRSPEEGVRRGALVLTGRAVERDSPLPFRPVAEALFSHLRKSGPPQVRELAPFLPILGRLIPRVASPWRVTRGGVARGPGRSRAQAARRPGRRCWLRARARGPAMGGRRDVEVVEYLADNIAGEPVLCLVSLRGERTQQGLVVRPRPRRPALRNHGGAPEAERRGGRVGGCGLPAGFGRPPRACRGGRGEGRWTAFSRRGAAGSNGPGRRVGRRQPTAGSSTAHRGWPSPPRSPRPFGDVSEHARAPGTFSWRRRCSAEASTGACWRT